MLDRHIHAYVRALFGSSALRVGPFLAGLDPHDAGRYRNYAVPDDGAAPSADEVAALVTAFAGRDRIPRLEYLPSACPDLETALTGAGFTVEVRIPVLTGRPGRGEAVTVAGVEVVPARTDDELWAVAGAQAEAYAQPEVTVHDRDRLRGVLDHGGLVALARDAVTGAGVGGGLCAPPHDGVSELAAIGVRTAYRRRGIAAALTAELTRACPEVGIGTPFLTPAGPAEQRIYERAGYQVAGEMIHISR